MSTQTIWGTISSGGNILAGSGFKSTHESTGEYSVVFDERLDNNSPCIVLTGVSGATDPSDAGCIATSVVTPSNSGFYVRLKGAENGDYLDRNFSFIAMG